VRTGTSSTDAADEIVTPISSNAIAINNLRIDQIPVSLSPYYPE
jgi:hypothetical protein